MAPLIKIRMDWFLAGIIFLAAIVFWSIVYLKYTKRTKVNKEMSKYTVRPLPGFYGMLINPKIWDKNDVISRFYIFVVMVIYGFAGLFQADPLWLVIGLMVVFISIFIDIKWT